MGYDLHRFTQQVDFEFRCPVCHFVLENAMESTKCEHIFCDECIKSYIASNKVCPVDKKPLKTEDLKPITRVLRNLLFKLEIKCDFESQGCKIVSTLENLPNHVKTCFYDPNLQVKCDKDCGLEMSQKEFATHNCVAKLANIITNLQKQISFLREERFLVNKQQWICPNGLTVSKNQVIECLQKEFGEQYSAFSTKGFAQSSHSVSESSDYFDMKIVDIGDTSNVSIGLAYDHTIRTSDGIEIKRIEYCGLNGKINVFFSHNLSENEFCPKWQTGDTIGCGVRFPKQDERKDRAVVYFNRNDSLIWRKEINNFVGLGSFYPTIYMNSLGAKVIANFRNEIDLSENDHSIVSAKEEMVNIERDFKMPNNTNEYRSKFDAFFGDFMKE